MDNQEIIMSASQVNGLTAEQKSFYQTNGYIVVKWLISREEAAMYRAECHALAERLAKLRDIDATWGAAKSMAQDTKLLHSHDVQFHSAAFARLIVDPRVMKVAQDIIGPNVQLHHTKMFIKPPEKGSPFPLHQDKPFFPHENDSMIAAIFHFDDAPLEKGCLCVVPGSHKSDLPHEREGLWHLSPEKYPLSMATPLPAQAGDVVFFSYRTIHGSGLNTSNEARTTMLLQMRDPADPPTIRTHESRGQGMMLAGIDPTCCTTKAKDDVSRTGPAVAGAMGNAMAPAGAMAAGAMAGGAMAGGAMTGGAMGGAMGR
jgi:ectoine hydroxylase-related dioxygenase (phytanoyl-CoA dioxygenase family)